MKKYRFAVSRKVKLWITDYVEVEANDLVDAVRSVEEEKDDAIYDGWGPKVEKYDNETCWDDVTPVTEEENDGNEVERIEYVGVS